jgi:hypothetical protein
MKFPILAFTNVSIACFAAACTVVSAPPPQTPPPAPQAAPPPPPVAPPPPAAVAPPPPAAVAPPAGVQPGKHPAFLHALSDLRFARANLERKAGDAESKWDEARAVGNIDDAIKEIRSAAVDDGKNLTDHPAVDASLKRGGRLHHALESLEAARRDVNEEEDDNFAQGLKRRALQHINAAVERTKEGLCNDGDKAFCPK